MGSKITKYKRSTREIRFAQIKWQKTLVTTNNTAIKIWKQVLNYIFGALHSKDAKLGQFRHKKKKTGPQAKKCGAVGSGQKKFEMKSSRESVVKDKLTKRRRSLTGQDIILLGNNVSCLPQ